MSFLKHILILVNFCLVITSGCSGKDKTSSIPSDFVFILDGRSRQNTTEDLNINIKINAQGVGHFAYYDPGGTIYHDPNGIVTYEANQVVKSGKFRLTESELVQLWEMLNKNHFFDLNEDYQMEIGHSYAFIMVEANDKRHIVDNIGMEVPEIRAIVEGADAILPLEISLKYGNGFTP